MRQKEWCWIVIISLAAFYFPYRAQAAQTTFTASQDTTIKLSAPDTNFSSASSLDAVYQSGDDPTRAPLEVQEGLVQFDLASLPKGAIISKAVLILASQGSASYGYADVRIRAITANWDNNTTWNSRPSYQEDSAANVEVANNQFPAEIDITPLVRNWQSGAQDNHGIAIRAFGDGDYSKGLYTAEDAHASSKEGPNGPKLKVDYTVTSSTSTPPPSNSTSTPTPAAGSSSGGSSAGTTTNTTTSTSSGSSPSPAPGTTSSSGGSGQFIDPETNLLEEHLTACLPEITDLRVILSDTESIVRYTSQTASKGQIYFYETSKTKPVGVANKLASGFDQGSIVIRESSATTSHALTLKPLQPKTTYYFTLLDAEKQECEHRFTSSRSIGGDAASVIGGVSKGFQDKLSGSISRNPLGKITLAPGTSPLALVGTLIQAGFSVATSGHTVPWMTILAYILSLLTLLALGQSTARRIIQSYITIKNLPNWWRGQTSSTKKHVTWGRVLSSISIRAIPSAVVNLYDAKSGRLITHTVSDRQGFFGFAVGPGTYYASAVHGGYSFPASVSLYGYRGEPFVVDNPNGFTQLDIPMDPAELRDRRLQQVEKWLIRAELFRLPLLVVASILAVYGATTHLSVVAVAAVLFLGLLWWNEWQRRNEARYCLTVVNAAAQPLPLVFVQIKDSHGHTVLRHNTNEQGVLFVSLPAGSYTVTISSVAGIGTAKTLRSTQTVVFSAGLRIRPLTLQV